MTHTPSRYAAAPTPEHQGRIALRSHWYAVRTNIRCEERARMGIAALGVMAYLPREPLWRGRGKDRRRVSRPLLPRFLFVEVHPLDNPFEAIRRTNGVESILRDSREGPPVRLRAGDIETIQAAEAELVAKFEREAARLEQLGRKKRDDPEDFVAQIVAAPPEQRVERLLEMLGRGRTTTLRLATLAQVM